MQTEPAHKLTVKILGELRTIQGYDIDEFKMRRAELIDGLKDDLEVIQLAHAISNAAPLTNVVGTVTVTEAPEVVTQSAAPTWAAAPAPAPSFTPPSAQAPAAFVGSAPMCDHGPRTPRNGNGQNGPYKAWFCCTAKGTPNQCKPVFVNRGTAEYANFPV